MAYSYDRREAAMVDLHAIETLQDLVPQVDAATHDAVRQIIRIGDPAIQRQTAKTLVDMLEMEIGDYQRTIRNLKSQYKV